MRNAHEEEFVMKKGLLPIMTILLMMAIVLSGCGGKSEPVEETEKSLEITEEAVPRVESIKCENHGAVIMIPGEYSPTDESNENSLVYSNPDGSKAIGFSFTPYIQDDSATTISWDSIIENLSGKMKIETYEEMSFDGLPGLKLYVDHTNGFTGEMAVIVDQDNDSGYTIQMLESGKFDEEGTFDKIIGSFKIVPKEDAIVDKIDGGDTTTETLTDIELLTFDGHPKFLDDYDSAKQKWGRDDRVTLKNGEGTTSDFENIIINAESRGTNYIGYEKYHNNKLNSIEIYFDSCSDEASTLHLDDALLIIRGYLPLEIIEEKYHITDSVQWPDNESGGKVYFIRYSINEGISEDEYEEAGLTGGICVRIWVDQDGIVKYTRLDVMGVVNYLGTEYTEWNYDFLEAKKE